MALDLNGNKLYSSSISTKGEVIKSIPNNGLIGYYDPGNLNSYIGSGTTWTDISSYGNNLSINNGSFNSGNGGSIVFNGSNTYAYKSSVAVSSYNIFTMAMFVKFADTGSGVGGRFIFSFGRDIGGSTGGLALFAYGFASASSGQVIFELGSGYGRVSFGFVPTVGQWYYLVATADGSNTRTYVNGVLQNTAAQTTGAIASSPGLSLGSYLSAATPPAASTYWHNGNIGATAMYNRALSASEITQSYLVQKGRYGL